MAVNMKAVLRDLERVLIMDPEKDTLIAEEFIDGCWNVLNLRTQKRETMTQEELNKTPCKVCIIDDIHDTQTFDLTFEECKPDEDGSGSEPTNE